MNTYKQILDSAKRTIALEHEAVANLNSLIDQDFAKAVLCIYNAKGRVIISGVGKSAIIAQKMVATLNSTGTPSVFMHAADAIHGDLGTIQKDDVVVCLSNSGNTAEIKVLIPLIKNQENTVIAMTSNKDSFLAKNADALILAYAEKEACPHNLAPTTSTTVQLVMGDALALALLDLRGFSKEDFAKYHPGGALGKKMYLRVNELIALHEKPEVSPETPIKQVIVEISQKRLGVTAVTEQGKIVGIITDGDIRRMLETHDTLTNLTAASIMSKNPKTIDTNAMATAALDVLEKNSITQLLAVDSTNNYAGVVHLHDLIKEGIL
ncbi:KpsF/GutQ family sugar-phosphate isomerase [Leeuwenhoekiella marinoflava]|uniref:Arabinose-5-phosphate isomerase n=2 Tax=Leeuwenhoekiella marinoflava TaxID=988 RepID=A0A4Q0PII2_9FLAO|nr:KpsF/GutQ family sugar-phosphate isomerase [Leeuwenhoekiella marinoflava]RXG26904.1 arabinose-5-phosphate isomerase [Leeuwenhoekiella marinoflava]SHF40753.1 arabinose-5-phosphate isomerase [Leeuwenhoekiella marinoflava DSM 3653]